MDNYLRVMEKLFYLREYVETSMNEQQHRKMYLALMHLEEEAGIKQCDNCAAYYDYEINQEDTGLCLMCRK